MTNNQIKTYVDWLEQIAEALENDEWDEEATQCLELADRLKCNM